MRFVLHYHLVGQRLLRSVLPCPAARFLPFGPAHWVVQELLVPGFLEACQECGPVVGLRGDEPRHSCKTLLLVGFFLS
jgi:hypothetical protein